LSIELIICNVVKRKRVYSSRMSKALALKRTWQSSSWWSHRKWITHTLFWLLVLATLCFFDYRITGWPLVLYTKLIDVIFYAAIIYLNLLYLIPNFLTAKRFWIYVSLLLGSVLILTPIKVAIQVFLFANEPTIQSSLVENQSYYFLSMFLIMGSSTIYSIISEWLIHQSEKRDLQTQTMQSELKFLRSQVNPHFLFNTLNNLYALTLKKSDDAPEIVLKLSEIMRYMLYECNERTVSLSKEITYLRNYLDLEQLRQSRDIKIDMQVIGNVSDHRIAPLIFIPFVENSFKHGLNNQISEGYVTIVLKVESNKLEFMIENSKPATQPAQTHRRSGGIGLVNVKRRLNLIYADRYRLKINNEPNSYQVNLILQL